VEGRLFTISLAWSFLPSLSSLSLFSFLSPAVQIRGVLAPFYTCHLKGFSICSYRLLLSPFFFPRRAPSLGVCSDDFSVISPITGETCAWGFFLTFGPFPFAPFLGWTCAKSSPGRVSVGREFFDRWMSPEVFPFLCSSGTPFVKAGTTQWGCERLFKHPVSPLVLFGSWGEVSRQVVSCPFSVLCFPPAVIH